MADETPVNTGPVPVIPGVGIPIYIRVDLNVNVTGNPPKAREDGIVLGDQREVYQNVTLSSEVPFSQDWISEDFDGRASFGVGLGFRLPGGFRFEFTADRRHQTDVTIDGSGVSNLVVPPVGFALLTDFYASTKERTDIDGGLFMANGYFDIPISGPLKAYFGGGLGLAWTQFERENTTLMYAFGSAPGRRVLYSKTARETDNDFSLAAAAAFGVSYQISNLVELDVGYRLVHIEGAEGDLAVGGHNSTLSLDDANQHEIRIGVRLSPY